MSYSGIEIYVAGDMITKLECSDFRDNPDVVALFNPNPYDDDGEYQGDGCDRLEINGDTIFAAMDGMSDEGSAIVVDECQRAHVLNPDLKYLVVSFSYDDNDDDDDDEVAHVKVLFMVGFNSLDNPMKKHHGKFYKDYVVTGI